MSKIESFAQFLEAMSGNLFLSCVVVVGVFLLASKIASAWNKSGQIDNEAVEAQRKRLEEEEEYR